MTKWISLIGTYEELKDGLVFKGGIKPQKDGQPGIEIGNFLSDQYFGGGRIQGNIKFHGDALETGCGFILYHRAKTNAFVAVQVGQTSLVSLRTWSSAEWTTIAAQGSAEQLKPDTDYHLDVSAIGSRVEASIDGIKVLSANLSFSLPLSQAGIWAMGPSDVTVSKFVVAPEVPLLFVIMQFTPPFDRLFSDVIEPVGTAAGFEVVRADELAGPGLIIADIEQQIVSARAIVADITPNNPNVFWEVGYAHALRKPTILVAERDRQLPFDVSPFRVLFYDDTIAGKSRIEEGLERHLKAIQAEGAST